MGHPKAGGRQKGTPNKRTVAKMIEVGQQIADAKAQGHKQAVVVLDELVFKAVRRQMV